MINVFKVFLLGFSMFLFFFDRAQDISFFMTSTVIIEDSLTTVTESTYDSLTGQEIFQIKDSNGLPLHYYVQLNTGVCFDNICRPINIFVYWNITGRYLGFELLDGEFLSKYDHVPFTQPEYERLHMLLADPFLPLKEYSFEDLIEKNDANIDSVDGISGATSQELLDYVVDGAAYTTYKLWNFAYGPIQQQVISLTEQQLDSILFLKILESQDQSDRTWALERIPLLPELSGSVLESIMKIIGEGEYFQSYLALKSISAYQLNSEILQVKLFNATENVDSGIEDLIFDKLKKASKLSPTIVEQSKPKLESMKGIQLVKVLNLFKHHEVKDQGLCIELQSLSHGENAFLNNQVLQFLESGCKQ